MRRHRLLRAAVIGSVLALGLATAPGSTALHLFQTLGGGVSWTLGLRVPAATESALRAGEGVAWDQVRRNGLTYSARGQGSLSLVMFSVTFEDGRAVSNWASPKFSMPAGSGLIPGRYLPSLPAATRIYGAKPATTPLRGGVLDVLSRDGASAGDAGPLLMKIEWLPTEMKRGRRLVLFIVPVGAGAGSTTNPLFAMPERFD